jgi:hypothetical protein
MTPRRKAALMNDANSPRKFLRRAWPAEFDDGVRSGLTLKFEGPRELGGYSKGFHSWPLEKRNAWFSGFNVGYVKRTAAR